jgi:hypothetical protein
LSLGGVSSCAYFPRQRGTYGLCVGTKGMYTLWVQYMGGGVRGIEGGCDGKLVALKVQWGGERIYGTKNGSSSLRSDDWPAVTV